MDDISATAQPAACVNELKEVMTLFQRTLPSDFLEKLQPSSPQMVFTPWVTVWMLIYQRLHHNASLANVLGAFVDSMHMFSFNKRAREGTLSTNTGGVSRARSRLKVTAAEQAADHVFQTLLPQTPRLLGGRRVLVVDGTTVALSSNARLREVWPPASNQHGFGPWPICHLAILHELETGMMLRPETGPMYGPNAQSEITIAQQMLPRIPEKSVLMADRNFGVFGFVYAAVQAGHDTITRLTESRFHSMQKRAVSVRPGVWRLPWKPTAQERRKYPDLPADAAVSLYLHEIVGSTSQKLWVATTLDIGTDALSVWYLRRGEIETDIRQSKKTLHLDSLRGQSVDMIHKELAMHAIAYNLVVQVRYLASLKGKIAPKRLSFTGVWNLVDAILLKHSDRTPQEWQEKFEFVLRKCLQRKLPNRPGRSYPREAYYKRSTYPARKKPGDCQGGK